MSDTTQPSCEMVGFKRDIDGVEVTFRITHEGLMEWGTVTIDCGPSESTVKHLASPEAMASVLKLLNELDLLTEQSRV